MDYLANMYACLCVYVCRHAVYKCMYLCVFMHVEGFVHL